MNKIAANLKAFKEAVETHDRENPSHNAWGIGMCHFDLERLGFESGERLWGNITIHEDEGQSGNFRVLCDAKHSATEVQVENIKTPLVVA